MEQQRETENKLDLVETVENLFASELGEPLITPVCATIWLYAVKALLSDTLPSGKF